MSTKYIRGSASAFRNPTKITLDRSLAWGKNSHYAAVVILRGVGYKFFQAINDLSAAEDLNTNYLPATLVLMSTNQDKSEKVLPLSEVLSITNNDYSYSKYLIVRAGHTKDLYQPIPVSINIKILKKDRKLVIHSSNKQQVSQFLINLFNYRKPSVYTGRGVRRKHVKVLRKAGKKDQKGRF